MLHKLLPSFYGVSEDKGTNLSSGGNPENLLGQDKEIVAKFDSLPAIVQQKDVAEIAHSTGRLEASNTLMKKYSEYAIETQKQALASLDIRINHSQQSMANESQYRKKIARHGKNVLEHRIDVNTVKNNIDGYQQALDNANQTIHL